MVQLYLLLDRPDYAEKVVKARFVACPDAIVVCGTRLASWTCHTVSRPSATWA